MVYQKQIRLALIGVTICVMPVVLPLIPRIGAYAEAQRVRAEMELRVQNLKTQEEFERSRIAERALTSEQLYKAGIAPNATKLRIRRYLDNQNQDPKPDTTGWGTDEVVYVYDSAGVCVGRIEQNQWYWKHKYDNACDGRPN
ncbi:hypothetical protein F7734_12915 [Scytonema sp. UIC 10036]|uniref:hypothetical protein n=1 Tax=Scytonema sp. UIC 10036 TaxID=2304196 RepID=UPI0012DAAC5A|nr:hypothetical protein [Scytonema sp. UIC 10036]MUG93283.1 hypothetical protein [Scytonema sp. UIC 10036]